MYRGKIINEQRQSVTVIGCFSCFWDGPLWKHHDK